MDEETKPMKTILVNKPRLHRTNRPAHPALKEPVMFSLQIEGESSRPTSPPAWPPRHRVDGHAPHCIQVVYLADAFADSAASPTPSPTAAPLSNRPAPCPQSRPLHPHHRRRIERIHSHSGQASKPTNSASTPPSTTPSASVKTSWTSSSTSPATASITP